jgi:hypothetical protein
MDPAGAEQDFAFAGTCHQRKALGIPVNRPYVNSGRSPAEPRPMAAGPSVGK